MGLDGDADGVQLVYFDNRLNVYRTFGRKRSATESEARVLKGKGLEEKYRGASVGVGIYKQAFRGANV